MTVEAGRRAYGEGQRPARVGQDRRAPEAPTQIQAAAGTVVTRSELGLPPETVFGALQAQVRRRYMDIAIVHSCVAGVALVRPACCW